MTRRRNSQRTLGAALLTLVMVAGTQTIAAGSEPWAANPYKPLAAERATGAEDSLLRHAQISSRKKDEEVPYRRTKSIDYLSPVVGYYLSDDTPVGVCSPYPGRDQSLGCPSFRIMSGERYIEVALSDELSEDVFAVLETFHTSGRSERTAVCNATEDPIELEPYTRKTGAGHFSLMVYVLIGSCANGEQSLPTQGTVEVTFYKKDPRKLRGWSKGDRRNQNPDVVSAR